MRVCVCVRACVYMCVRVCACVCACVHPYYEPLCVVSYSTLLSSFLLSDSERAQVLSVWIVYVSYHAYAYTNKV